MSRGAAARSASVGWCASPADGYTIGSVTSVPTLQMCAVYTLGYDLVATIEPIVILRASHINSQQERRAGKR